MLRSGQIRRQFLDYFGQEHGHVSVPSSPVVPLDDPTLLFTNAGMNQFKDLFLGTATGDRRDWRRVVNSQKCIRAGGKHNDLEDVGKDTYHHTFFEMLGNWSFGDYFKREAVRWSWDLLTRVWGLEGRRLHATVFEGSAEAGIERDEEAAEFWRSETGIDPSHVHYCGMKDNFWEMGDTGPCGPCSEVHIDLTPDLSGRALVNADDPRVMEIWNLVFIQYNRDVGGTLAPLPSVHVDTGMGFERICAVLQKKNSNYDTDVFSDLFDAIRDLTGSRPYGAGLDDPIDTAYRVIADHIRCLTFAVTDGAVPGNEGRGYVLRRILRRAVRHGWQTLGTREPFLCRLVPAVVELMGDAFPELTRGAPQVAALIAEEEESFQRTLDRGIALFDKAAARHGRQISGDDAFRLHDTYGFPLDLTEVMAAERGLTVDVAAFERLMARAREVARAGGSTAIDLDGDLTSIVQRHEIPATEFVGYETMATDGRVVAAFRLDGDGAPAPAGRGDRGRLALVVDRTPFYAEAGGQVGDRGTIQCPGGRFVVTDTRRLGDVWFHLGTFEADGDGGPAPGDEARLAVDEPRRRRTMANHTGTHLLNRALRALVNDQADQRGSLVDEQRLRFDFVNHAAVSVEQLGQVQDHVNADIAADLPVHHAHAPLEQGRAIRGLRAVFGEKYPRNVRIVSIGVPVDRLLADPDNDQWADRSIEFCGGTHLGRTSEAARFAIVSEEAVAKGIRRITALTGEAAARAEAEAGRLARRAKDLAAGEDAALAGDLPGFLEQVAAATLPVAAQARLRRVVGDLQKRVRSHQRDAERDSAGAVVEAARAVADGATGAVVVAAIPGADARTLRTAMDVIRKRRPESALLLGAVDGDKVAFIAAVPPALIERGLKAGDWVRQVAQAAGGGGGGRPDMAQAGGKDPSLLDAALGTAERFAVEKLG